ncbi:hypothetical protein EVAR_54314_1 [Eumeta japonica]|uniref:Uncharacterized protein n=1 Tax=Eumeta variegata TaxID=151549 RepID=A0A4C1Z2M8_EUMVA|nr:hypothetical protein EVAR_54314_1 [Eumeta japonica]
MPRRYACTDRVRSVGTPGDGRSHRHSVVHPDSRPLETELLRLDPNEEDTGDVIENENASHLFKTDKLEKRAVILGKTEPAPVPSPTLAPPPPTAKRSEINGASPCNTDQIRKALSGEARETCHALIYTETDTLRIMTVTCKLRVEEIPVRHIKVNIIGHQERTTRESHEGRAQTTAVVAEHAAIAVNNANTMRAYLNIVPVELNGPEGSLKVHTLHDEGSTITIIDEQVEN